MKKNLPLAKQSFFVSTLLTIFFCLSVLPAKSQSCQLVKDIAPDAYAGSGPRYFTDVNGTLFFTANDGAGYGLWKSDGTESGTVKIKAPLADPGGSIRPEWCYVNANGTLFFWANDGIHGYELWKSDGTEAGTVMVKDIWPGSGGSLMSFFKMVNVGGEVYFNANDSVHGNEFWKSDGTEAGTVMIKDINPGSNSSNPSNWGQLSYANGTLFFGADDGTHGYELWKSDGTTAGTVMMGDMRPGADASYPDRFTVYNNTLIYVSDGANVAQEGIWQTDGVYNNFITDKLGTTGLDPILQGSVIANGKIYAQYYGGNTGNELWISDMTDAGTKLLKDINVGTSGSNPQEFTEVNGTVFFRADDGGGYALWKTDGTENGTVKVKYLASYSFEFTDWFTAMDGKLFASVQAATGGEELWVSDGTTDGTVMLCDIAPGDASSIPQSLKAINGTLYFSADDGGYASRELWKYGVTTGITKNALDENLKVYPVPARNVLHIDYYTTEFPVKVTFQNMLGDVIQVSQMNTTGLNMDVSKLPAGAYVLQLQNANGTTARQVIVAE